MKKTLLILLFAASFLTAKANEIYKIETGNENSAYVSLDDNGNDYLVTQREGEGEVRFLMTSRIITRIDQLILVEETKDCTRSTVVCYLGSYAQCLTSITCSIMWQNPAFQISVFVMCATGILH